MEKEIKINIEIEHKNTKSKFQIKLCLEIISWLQKSLYQTSLLTIKGFDYKGKVFLKGEWLQKRR